MYESEISSQKLKATEREIESLSTRNKKALASMREEIDTKNHKIHTMEEESDQLQVELEKERQTNERLQIELRSIQKQAAAWKSKADSQQPQDHRHRPRKSSETNVYLRVEKVLGKSSSMSEASQSSDYNEGILDRKPTQLFSDFSTSTGAQKENSDPKDGDGRNESKAMNQAPFSSGPIVKGATTEASSLKEDCYSSTADGASLMINRTQQYLARKKLQLFSEQKRDTSSPSSQLKDRNDARTTTTKSRNDDSDSVIATATGRNATMKKSSTGELGKIRKTQFPPIGTKQARQ